MTLNHTHLISTKKQFNETTKTMDTSTHKALLPKSNIFESEMAIEYSEPNTPLLTHLFKDSSFMQEINKNSNYSVSHQMIKVQKNIGNGGCFPCHFDTSGADGRQVTAILYLNKNWNSDANGGHLQLFPCPLPVKNIEPIENRLVIFSSYDMLHRVCPTSMERYCLTLWLYGEPPTLSRFVYDVNKDTTANNLLDFEKQALQVLFNPPFRKYFIKWIYRNDWAKSISDSHPDTEETRNAILNHWADVTKIETILQSLLAKNNLDVTLSDLEKEIKNTIK